MQFVMMMREEMVTALIGGAGTGPLREVVVIVGDPQVPMEELQKGLALIMAVPPVRTPGLNRRAVLVMAEQRALLTTTTTVLPQGRTDLEEVESLPRFCKIFYLVMFPYPIVEPR